MAKKRKKSAKKEVKEASTGSALPEGFWSQVGVIILILIAVLLAFGVFGAGGTVPETIYIWARRFVGYTALILPLLFVYAAIQKQRGENHLLSRATFWGLLVFIISLSGFIHLFTDELVSLEAADAGNGGGLIGHLINSALLTLFNKVAGGIVLAVIVLVSFHFVLRLPLTTLLRMMRIEGKKNRDEDEEEENVKEEKSKIFQLNEGVPIQRSRLGSLKNTAEKLTVQESHEALTTSSDPDWVFPSLELLNKKQDKADAGDIEGIAAIIKDTMKDFNINVEMEGANVGPRVTQYTLRPPAGVRLTKITALENNLALNLAATSIRMEAPIPGKRAVGIEVPNAKAATVRLHGILESGEWKQTSSPLSFAIGRDIAGQAVVGPLDKMPHLLIAGATGSGKSIMINTLLTSLLYRNSPADMKLILVDPKRVELTPYHDIPHLITPVIVEPEKCISALKWAVAEMERRYSALAEVGKRNILEYNKLKKEEGMPYIVIVIDELSDLMMIAARDVEALIVRLAQKARAVGIHLVLATQRPSVDVITGLIKANVPARLAFTVSSQVDSRTIIDQAGAEKLLGQGDMLMLTPEMSKPKRIQGAFVDDKEVHGITNALREARAPEYDDEVVAQPVQLGGKGGVVGGSGDSSSDDAIYEEAVQVVIDSGKASASLLQRRLRVGYARAARLIESMEEQGIIGAADGARPREVLISSIDDIHGGGEMGDEEY